MQSSAVWQASNWKKNGAPLQQLARTDSMEYRGFVLRAETPNVLARAVKDKACCNVLVLS